ncbi:phytanoyl-CoA dioxygenase family protein [Pseudoalteromonas umbrosa]|uniref:phytanoyl-CoA dioxygenase family protein n=1 Tax=Pseudoalteromonas umbrosa TaxID=3048489 RepID=UPI0024C455EA|nr:phytanoyl-CoA dioxygenase family protein [Pseudoalteromonas sp. B95]MDK1290628.1 phytanoyl-CoA dioxygenase family protein [Pseudoalteromonas sp. B95]
MLTQEQVNFYNENGYLVVDNLISPDSLSSALEAVSELTEGEGTEGNFELEPKDGTVIRRIWSPTKKHTAFWDIAKAPELLDKLSCLIGDNIEFHYSKMNMKGPKVGSIVEWHQDFAFYPHTNSDLLTVLIALDDMKIENGCLKVVPGSHKQGLYDHFRDGFFSGKISEVDESKAVNLEVKAGGAIFLHCLTKHSSEKNTSSQPRRTFLPAYRAADAFPIYFGPHAAHNEPGATLLRGHYPKFARVESGVHQLPLAEKEFGSIYEVQEGAHLNKSIEQMKVSGYAVD